MTRFFGNLLIFILTASFLYAENFPLLNNEFWFFMENQPGFGVIEEEEQDRMEQTKAKIRSLLEEAVYVYSGMIYGFDFSYTPGDRKRGVKEEFIMTPVYSIPFGDPALSPKQTRKEKSRTYIRIEYRCNENHKNWINYWKSSSFPVAGGNGTGYSFEDLQGKISAMENASKEAIFNFMRTRIHNKPKTISGSFVFESPPGITSAGGLYNAAVKIKIEIKDIDIYNIF